MFFDSAAPFIGSKQQALLFIAALMAPRSSSR
jgi:hypothetical protein